MTDGCITHAGILTPGDDKQLTIKAKQKFIKDIKDELMFGTEGISSLFPCGDPVQANPFAGQLDLENEKKFPEFHKNVLGTYLEIAIKLDLESDFKILPICDPIAIGFKLGVKIKKPKFPDGFIAFLIPNPPLLALKMKKMPPPKLIAQFPSLITIPPKLPIPPIPNIKFPDFDALLDFKFAFWNPLVFPSFFGELVLNLPGLLLKLPNIPDLFAELCKLAQKAKLVGGPKAGTEEQSIVMIVAQKVLLKKVVEMVFILAVGTTIGSASAGITGGIGSVLGYDPPPDDSTEEPVSVRDTIVSYANDCIDFAWGPTDKRDEYAQKLLYVEYGDGNPADPSSAHSDKRAIGKQLTIAKLEEASSCGLLARACLFSGGASYVLNNKVDTSKQNPNVTLYYDFFQDRYEEGKAISSIIKAAYAKSATYNDQGEHIKNDLPPLKKGDVIIIYNPSKAGNEHAMVVVEDYKVGSFELVTVEGGQIDKSNKNRPTAIKKKTYSNSGTNPKLVIRVQSGSNNVLIGGRKILTLIDSEKLCTDDTGTNMSISNVSTEYRDVADGNDDTNPSQEIGV